MVQVYTHAHSQGLFSGRNPFITIQFTNSHKGQVRSEELSVINGKLEPPQISGRASFGRVLV